jgi:hypothetical protein
MATVVTPMAAQRKTISTKAAPGDLADGEASQGPLRIDAVVQGLTGKVRMPGAGAQPRKAHEGLDMGIAM